MKRNASDVVIALTVIACSLVLLAALAIALAGNPFLRSSRTLRVQMSDATGIQRTSQVKLGGAVAGTVSVLRMLTPEERIATGDPANVVELTLALNRNVPALNEGLQASVASDTILSDKFILLSGGDPSAPLLTDGELVPGTAPTTIDELSANLNLALNDLRAFASGTDGEFQGLLPRIGKMLDDASALVAEARGLVTSADGFVSEGSVLVKNGETLVSDAGRFVASGQSLIDDNKAALRETLQKLSAAANTLDDLARRADQTLRNNEGNIDQILADTRIAAQNLKVTAVTAKYLLDSLARRPQQLIWGTRRAPNEFPSEQEILSGSPPAPAQ